MTRPFLAGQPFKSLGSPTARILVPRVRLHKQPHQPFHRVTFRLLFEPVNHEMHKAKPGKRHCVNGAWVGWTYVRFELPILRQGKHSAEHHALLPRRSRIFDVGGGFVTPEKHKVFAFAEYEGCEFAMEYELPLRFLELEHFLSSFNVKWTKPYCDT